MKKLLSSPRFTYFWLPFGLAIIAVVIAFWVQDIPVFRRNALLLALLAGVGFFHPVLRHWLLILFCYGFGFYVWTKFFLDIDRWSSMSDWARVQTALWVPIGFFCVMAAMGMATKRYKKHGISLLLIALSVYFAGYAYEELTLKRWIQAIAGLGFVLVGLVSAIGIWIEELKKAPATTEQQELSK